jgi:hypothetical protein
MLLGVILYLLFSLMAAAGAFAIGLTFRGRRAAWTAALVTILFFAVLYGALARWVFAPLAGL